ncbi:MAG: c-type cytochrome [Granulosicoccus sp.]|nr:c-type cytochrome [Granulosicoccus sp.]
MRYLTTAVIPLIALLFCSNSLAADASKGKQIFAQCAGCHAMGVDAKHLVGPQLNGIVDRDVASADGYDYSDAFLGAAEKNMVWDEETLDAFLAAPMNYLPGTRMVYLGLPNEQDRADVIAWLAMVNPDGTSKADSEMTTGQSGQTDNTAGTTAGATEDEAHTEPRPLAKDAAIPEHGALHLGRVALDEEVLAWDIDIRPDGLGLPPGSGTANDGADIYDAQCAACHGVFGEGEGRWPILAGGFDTLTDDRPEKTIGSYWPYLSTVFDYVKRAMPFGNARSLSDDEVYALSAYLLYLNDLVDEDFELGADNFASIQLPNAENFIPDNRADEPHYQQSSEPCMVDCIEGTATVLQRARVLDVTPDGNSE